MSFHDLVLHNRSYRRFHQEHAIPRQTLRDLVDLARLTASGSNLQPLRYALSADPATNARIFPYLGWAGYLHDWPGPQEGERPSAYVIILLDTTASKNAGCDHGIAAQTILLGATELGLGGCMIGSVQRDGLRAELHIPERYDILLVVALGQPAETVRLELMAPSGDVKYYRDEAGVHHVPKHTLDDLILDLS
jgi:nitroreductase